MDLLSSLYIMFIFNVFRTTNHIMQM